MTKTDITSNGGSTEESDDGGIPAILKASTETSLKFACLVRFIDSGQTSRKEILDAVLHLVGVLTYFIYKKKSGKYQIIVLVVQLLPIFLMKEKELIIHFPPFHVFSHGNDCHNVMRCLVTLEPVKL